MIKWFFNEITKKIINKNYNLCRNIIKNARKSEYDGRVKSIKHYVRLAHWLA